MGTTVATIQSSGDERHEHVVGADEAARTLVVAAAGTLLVLVAFTTITTIVGPTAATFGAGVTGQTWALSGMSLGLAATLLVAGALADDLGRRRSFVFGTIVLAAASLLATVAWSMPVEVVARVLQGVGGAGVLAASLGLIGHAFPSGAGRTRATGVWGAMVGAGIAFGPLLAALLEQHGGWRLVHAVEALAALALALAGRTLVESRSSRPSPIDLPGVATLAAGMGALAAGVIRGRSGWADPATIALLGGGLALLALFAVIELRRHQPMLDLSLFARPLFVVSTSGALFMGLALISLMSFFPTFGQAALGLSGLGTAAILALWSGTSAVVAWYARRLPARLDGRHRLIIAFLLCAVGELALTGLTTDAGWLRVAPGLLIAGVGSGIGNAALGRVAVESVPADRAGMGAGANNTARYFGGAAGVAIVVALVAAGGSSPGAAGLVEGWNLAAAVTAGLCLLAAAIAAVSRPSAARRPAQSPAKTAGSGPIR